MKWGALPKAGGMNEQDYRQMYLMNILAKVFDASKAFHNVEKKMSPGQTKIIAWLASMGVT